MRAARGSNFTLFLSSLACAVALSCGSDSTGPGGNNGVTISPDTANVALGSTVTLAATLTGGGSASFFWSSDNTSVATVSGTGVVTGVALGTAHIAASSSGKSGVATITVVPQGVASIRMTPTSAAISVGGTVHVQAEPLDASGNLLDGRTITWSSANESIATVDNTGVVTGVATGATTITATSEGKSGTSGIAVGAAVASSIAVEPTSVSITTGQTSQLTATVKDANGTVISGAPVTWTVDNSGIAIVSSTGLVTGQSAGSATVTATSGAAHVNVAVTVTLPPANAVIVSPSTVALLVTQRQQLTGTVTDASGNPLPGQTITWQSSDNAVATVGTTGLVFAVAPGTATITGTSGSVSGVSHVTVSLVPVRRVTVTPDALSFTQGDAGTQLTVALLDSVGGALSGRPVTFSSNNTGVASVSGTGFVTPGGPGQAVITITATGTGVSTTATVTVTPVPVASVIITPSPDTLAPSQAIQLTATPKDANGNTLTGRSVVWDGSDDAIAVVSSTGKVTAQSAGTMTVTATSEGKTGTATIVVTAVPVATVTISPTTQSVVVGGTTPAFTAVTKDANNNTLTGRVVTFSSSNTAVATIDANTGVATGVAPGTTSITATSEGKTSDAATLTVDPVPVGSVTISPTSESVVEGSTTPAFTAVTKDGSGNVLTGRTVTFSSSNTAVATIDPTSGVATGVSPGTSSITASSEGKTSNPATLTVDPAPVGRVTVNPSTQTITDGGSVAFAATLKDQQGHPLTGRTVSWDSSDQSVATIDNTGNATSAGPGTTTITATSEGKSGTASLQVDPVAVTSVVVTPAFDTTNVGSTVQLSASIQETNAGHGHTITWSSADNNIASVDSRGRVRGVAPGDVMITATTQGQSGSAQVTVLP
ncbi:MAG: Ig domain protein group 2 domain protein [Gemmatimonadetes bacterium]|nr:Ig domain protein group 2 domain protein [Gemmatimonadota bacterium]